MVLTRSARAIIQEELLELPLPAETPKRPKKKSVKKSAKQANNKQTATKSTIKRRRSMRIQKKLETNEEQPTSVEVVPPKAPAIESPSPQPVKSLVNVKQSSPQADVDRKSSSLAGTLSWCILLSFVLLCLLAAVATVFFKVDMDEEGVITISTTPEYASTIAFARSTATYVQTAFQEQYSRVREFIATQAPVAVYI